MSENLTLAAVIVKSAASAGAIPTPARNSVIESHQKSVEKAASAMPTVTISMRRAVAQRLNAGPRADLQAIRERLLRQVNPTISFAGWRVYDQYLKVNRVDEGTASYDDVVRLVLGTRAVDFH